MFDDGAIWDSADIADRLRVGTATNGDDAVFGSLHDDVVDLGTGNDQIETGAGFDRFAYSRGDGHDIIHATRSFGALEVVFDDLTPANVTAVESAMNGR